MKTIAIDVETTGLNPWRDELLGLSIAMLDGGKLETYWYPWSGPDTVLPRSMLADPTIRKVGHNLRFDVKFLTLKGIEVQGPWEDTKLMAQLINENRPLGLKPLAVEYLGPESLKAKLELDKHLKRLKLDMGKLGDPQVNQDLVREYCCEDTANTLKLFKKLSGLLEQDQRIHKYYLKEMLPLEKVLMEMELRGNLIDTTALAKAEVELDIRITAKVNELLDLLGEEIKSVRKELLDVKNPNQAWLVEPTLPPFNWNSPDHKIKLFYGRLGLGKFCSEQTKTGKPSLQRKVLSKLKLPDGKLKSAIGLQIEQQSYSKMKSAYVEGIKERLEGNIIHGEYYQASVEDFKNTDDDEGGTVTGRLSHRNPNLGNLPRKFSGDYWRGTFVKDLFIPPEGHCFLYADYSQVELRVAAHLSNDRPFIDAFVGGGDPHQATADALGLPGKDGRQQAKTLNFLLIYYGSPWRLAIELGWNPRDSADLRKAEHIRDSFFNAHPELHAWIWQVRKRVMHYGWVQSMFGRKRRLPEIWSANPKFQEHAYKQAGNFVVQSSAASITKLAMIQLRDAGFPIVNQVHDSITCLCPTELAPDRLPVMISIMEGACELSTGLKADGKILTTFKE